MTTLNVSIPEALRTFVDERVSEGAYSTSSEYLNHLITRDQERLRLRQMITDGIASDRGEAFDASYFDSLRQRANG